MAHLHDRRGRAAAIALFVAGCCNLPNDDYPLPRPAEPETTFIVIGDSQVDRHEEKIGYGDELAVRLGALGEVVANEGNAAREAGVAAIEDPVHDRCPAFVCHVFYDCLSKGNDPLVTVLAQHPNARKLLMTLGGVEASVGLALTGAVDDDALDPGKPLPRPLVDSGEAIRRNLSKAIRIALADRRWDFIGVTSYPYFATDSTEKAIPCSIATPVNARQQQRVNEIMRWLEDQIRGVAEREGVSFISLLDVHGGGTPAPGGERGPDGRFYDDCVHPTPEGYGAVVDRILATPGVAPHT